MNLNTSKGDSVMVKYVEPEEGEEQEDKKKVGKGKEPITAYEEKHNKEEIQKPQIDDMMKTFGSGDDGRRTKQKLKEDEFDEPEESKEDEEVNEEESEVDADDSGEDSEEKEPEEDESEEEKDVVEDTDEDEEEDEDKDQVIKDLRNRINDMAKGEPPLSEGTDEEPEEQEEEEEDEGDSEQKPAKKTVPKQKGDVLQFVSEEDMEDLTATQMNQILTQVYNQARQDMLRDIPEVAARTVQQRMEVETAVKSFYEDNPDLQDVREYTGQVANKVQSENPKWSIDQILNETAKTVRRNLHLSEKAEKRETERKEKEKKEEGKPGFTRKPRGSRSKGQDDEATGQQKQINDLLP